MPTMPARCRQPSYSWRLAAAVYCSVSAAYCSANTGPGVAMPGPRGSLQLPSPRRTIAPGVAMPVISNGYIDRIAHRENKSAPDDTTQAFATWFAQGGRGVDTAYMYKNQPQIGAAIAAAALPREALFVTTKIHCTGSAATALAMVKADLAQLGLARADLVLIHGTGFVPPFAPGNPTDCFGQKPCCADMAGIQATWAGLEEALAQNLTRAIGVSNHMVPHLEQLLATAKVRPAVNQMRTFVGYHDKAAFFFCRKHNVTWMAYSPLGPIGQKPKAVLVNPLVLEIAKTHNASAAQVGMAWVAQLPAVLTTASNSAQYDREDLSSTELVLSADEVKRLDSYNSSDVPPAPAPLKSDDMLDVALACCRASSRLEGAARDLHAGRDQRRPAGYCPVLRTLGCDPDALDAEARRVLLGHERRVLPAAKLDRPPRGGVAGGRTGGGAGSSCRHPHCMAGCRWGGPAACRLGRWTNLAGEELGSQDSPMLGVRAIIALARALLRMDKVLPHTSTALKTDEDNSLKGGNDGIDLDGSWRFETADNSFTNSVMTPGAWQAHGVGAPTALLHRQYVGIGTYSKTVDLSQRPPNSTCWLWIGGAPGGVVRSAIVSANGAPVGRHVGYLKPVEMQLPCTRVLNLSVAVDSRWNMTEDPLYGSTSWDLSFGGAGGIVGHAMILFRQPAWIEDSLHVQSTSLGDGSWQSTFLASVLGSVAGGGVLHVSVCEDVPGAPCTGGAVASAPVPNSGGRMSLAVTIPHAKLWIPGTRAARANLMMALFTLISADGSTTLATRSIRYGVKKTELIGGRIIFNGERLFLRGYGDDAAYATTAVAPTDKSFYYRQLGDMKALGFNFIRLHTHSMPTEFFDVADELGMLCNPEFAISHEAPIFKDGAWLTNPVVQQVFNESFTSIVQRHAYRPSIFAWVLSNEMYFSNASKYWYNSGDNSQLFVQLYRYAKFFDPERPCYFADGVTQTGLGTSVQQILGAELSVANLACRDGANASNAGCFADLLSTQAGWAHTQYPPTWFNPLWAPAGSPGSVGPPFLWYSPDDGSHLPADLPVPSIIHEAYDGRTFPRLEQNSDSFAGAIVKGGELYCDQSIQRLQELNLLNESDLWAQASEELYTEWMKIYIEGYHLDASTSAYEWVRVITTSLSLSLLVARLLFEPLTPAAVSYHSGSHLTGTVSLTD